MLNIDEAIAHAREVAEEQRELFRLCPCPSQECNGADICKCCGRKNDLNGLIVPMWSKTWYAGFLKTRHYQIDVYTCSSCGAVWESEPYEIE